MTGQLVYEKLSKITLPDYRIIFLVNDPTVQFNDGIDDSLNDNLFFKHVLLQFEEDKSFIHYINVKEPKTYEAFLDNLNDLLFLPNTTFSDLLKNFTCFSLFKFSPLYVRLRLKSNWKEEYI